MEKQKKFSVLLLWFEKLWYNIQITHCIKGALSMKIVILDAFTTNPGDLSWDWLGQYGEVTVYDRTPRNQIVPRCKDADIVITNKTPLEKAEIDGMPHLKFVALLSTGFNIADGAYLREKGIPLCNIPAYSTGAVAQLVFSFITAFTNAVAVHSDAVHAGEWTACPDFCFWKTPLQELAGKTLGIIGFGKIGQRVADIAEAFDMQILAASGHETDQSGRKNFRWTNTDEIAREADFITLHCPLNANTEGLVNAEFLSKMQKTAYLINTSRGPVVDDRALADALNSGKIAGAGLDVLSVEPPKADNPLLTAKNCLITPHIAWAGYETRARLVSVLQENFKAYFAGHPQNVVN